MPNLPTLLVGLVVFGAFAAVIARGVYNRKHGKSDCSCGCGDCPGKDLCHLNKKEI